MELYKFGLFALVLLTGAVFAGRCMRRARRNQGSEHGGGVCGMADGVDVD